jgi:hypothetical protein
MLTASVSQTIRSDPAFGAFQILKLFLELVIMFFFLLLILWVKVD